MKNALLQSMTLVLLIAIWFWSVTASYTAGYRDGITFTHTLQAGR